MTLALLPTSELLATLGQRLRAQRLAQGFPQRELAQMAKAIEQCRLRAAGS